MQYFCIQHWGGGYNTSTTKRIDAVPYAINFDFSLEAVCSLTECSRSTVKISVFFWCL